MTINQNFYLQILFSSQHNVGHFTSNVGFKFLTGLDDAFARFDLSHRSKWGQNLCKSHLNLYSLFISLHTSTYILCIKICILWKRFWKFKCDFWNSCIPLCSGYLSSAWRKHVQPSIVNCFFDIFYSLRWYVRPYPTLPNNNSGIIITFSRFYFKLRPVNAYYVSDKSKILLN